MKSSNSISAEHLYNIRFFFSKPELYSDNVTLLCFNKSRKYGLGTAADLISAAFENYIEDYPDNFLDILTFKMSCKSFVDQYKLFSKSDIYLFLEHPDYIKSPDPIVTRPWKRVIFDYENNIKHKKAYEWLNEYNPRERIDIALPVIKQYLVLTKNPKYIEQTALRIMVSLEKIHRIDQNEELVSCIDSIWRAVN